MKGINLMDEKKLKRNLLFNTVGNGIYYLSQWVITGWLVKSLSGEQGTYNAGLLSTAATIANMFLGLAGFGMRNYQVSDNSGQISDSAYAASRWITVGAASLFAVLYSLVMGYQKTPGGQFWCILLFLIYKMLEPLTDVWHGILQKAERMDIIGIAYTCRGFLSVAFFALGMLLTHNLVFSLALLTAVSVAFCILYDRRKTDGYWTKTSVDIRSVASLLLTCLPLAIHTFLNGVSTNLPKVYLERILGTEEMGIYNLVNSPVLILQVGIAYLFAPFITHFTHRLEEKDKKGFLHLTAVVAGIVVAAGLLGMLGCAVFGKWGLTFLYGDEKVTSASGLLYPMVICVVFSCFSVLLCMLCTVLRTMAGLLIANGLEILTAVAVSAPLIRKFGMTGASVATTVTLIVQCACLILIGLRALNKQTTNEESQ